MSRKSKSKYLVSEGGGYDDNNSNIFGLNNNDDSYFNIYNNSTSSTASSNSISNPLSSITSLFSSSNANNTSTSTITNDTTSGLFTTIFSWKWLVIIILLFLTVLYFTKSYLLDFFKSIQQKFNNILKTSNENTPNKDLPPPPPATDDEIHAQNINNSNKPSYPPSQPPPDTPNKPQNGPGWCYIGADDAFRTCTEINTNDLCMSGDIFPTEELCLNPNLRP